MGRAGLVFGLLDTTPSMGDPAVGARYRDLTISWMRYCYRDAIIEGRTVTEILRKAIERQYKYCLVLACGSIVSEHWNPDGASKDDFLSAILQWIADNDFLVAGRIVGGGDAWFGFDDRCLLVNVVRYRRLRAPRVEHPLESPIRLPKPVSTVRDNHIVALRPSGVHEYVWACLPGWPMISAS